MLHNSLLIFDFTGTLFDPFETIVYLLNNINHQRGFKYFNNNEIINIQRTNSQNLLNLFQIPQESQKNIVSIVLQQLEQHIFSIKPIPGLPDAIQKLKENDNHLIILSSNLESNIKKWLNHFDMMFFEKIISIGFGTSKIEYIRKIATSNVNKSSTYLVSDEAKDIAAANAVGIHSIGVTWGFDDMTTLKLASPTKCISNPNELLELI